jgi:ribonuclease HI
MDTTDRNVPIEEITVYASGQCADPRSGRGPGGWAYSIWNRGQQRRCEHGDVSPTSVNRVSMFAAILALKDIPTDFDGHHVTVHCDNSFLHQSITKGWCERWQRNGWETSQKSPVANIDLWEQLATQLNRFDVMWTKGRHDHLDLVREQATASIPQVVA